MNRNHLTLALSASVALGVALIGGAAASAAAAKDAPPRDGASNIAVASPMTRFVPGELLVRFRDGVGDAQRAEILRANGAERKRKLPIPGLELVRLERGRSVDAAIQALRNRPDIAYAEPNWIYRGTATPNDPRFGELWGLHQPSDADIDAPEAWDTTTGSANVTVAVVDTGVAYLHTDLAPNMWSNAGETGGGKETNGVDDDGNGYIDDARGWDMHSDDADPADTHGHGTHVSGTIGARGNDAFGVPGVNWAVRIMPVRVLGPNGGTNADVTEGFVYAAENGAKVVNASLGCAGCYSQAMKDAIDAHPNALYVVAAGNSSANTDVTPHYPCAYTSSNLVCVAATDRNDELAAFSNYGATSVDLAAPGVDILSTWRGFAQLLADGFEANLTQWATGGINNTWARTTEAAASGTWSVTDSPGDLYQPNTDSWLQTAGPVSFAGRNSCVVKYALKIQVGDASDLDTLYVDVSTDGGATWDVVDLWWGDGGAPFHELETDLSSLDGAPNILVRFRLFTDTDPPLQADGAYLDDVAIGCAGTGGGAADYESISGTSMATPHVAGVAALAWAKNPGVSVSTVKDAVLSGGNPLAVLAGKTVTGRRLNAAGTLALIPSPGPQTLTVSRSGTGSGTVTSAPPGIDCGIDCSEAFAGGTTVTLTATPADGSHRAGWTGCDSVVAGACIVQMSTAHSVTANFTLGTFADVPTSNPFFAYIEQLFQRGITTGCGTNTLGARLYCPTDFVARQQMAAFIVRAKGLTQLAPATPTFADVPSTNPFYGWIERLYEQGITTGCGTNGSGQKLYCPGDFVPRQQMAAFLVRAKGLTQLTPPTPTFADVPSTNPFYGWIERLYEQGITTGCGTNGSGQKLYCPGDLVARQQMAAFLIRAFP